MLSKEELRNIPVIDLGDIYLRAVKLEDHKDMFDYGSDERVTRMLTWPPYKTLDDALDACKKVFLSRPDRNLPSAYAIIHKEDEKMIGTCDFHSVNFNIKRGEIGYALNHEYWGRGYMSKACSAVIDFGFNYLHLDAIDISHDVDNISSRRVIEKAGFRFTKEETHSQTGKGSRFYEITKNDVIIRKMLATDYSGKGYVHYTSWMETYTGIIKQEYLDSMSLERSIEIAQQYPENTYVAVSNGKIIGFASYSKSRDDIDNTGEIMAIYVLREYSKKGIGKALMDKCLEELSNYKKVHVWVLSSNENAIEFYEHIGFQLDGVEKEVDIKTTVLHEVRLFKNLTKQ